MAITILQQWTAVVTLVASGSFFAITTDLTTPSNPQEEVEVDWREVSSDDLSLVEVGRIFNWDIFYRDSPGGQRERCSTIRFARF